MGRPIRRVHGHQPARGEPLGTRPARRVRDDLQPHRAAGDLEFATIRRSPTRRSRYPFLWNASRQDRTHWNGGIHNGLYIQALGRIPARSSSFADFTPHRVVVSTPLMPAIIDFKNNSINFAGLQTLEEKSPCYAHRHGHEKYSDSTSGWRRRANPCLTPICASCHAVQVRLTCRAFGAPPSSRLAPIRRCSSIRSAFPSPGCEMVALMPPPAIGARIGDPARPPTFSLLPCGKLARGGFRSADPVADEVGQQPALRAPAQGPRRAFSGENLDAARSEIVREGQA